MGSENQKLVLATRKPLQTSRPGGSLENKEQSHSSEAKSPKAETDDVALSDSLQRYRKVFFLSYPLYPLSQVPRDQCANDVARDTTAAPVISGPHTPYSSVIASFTITSLHLSFCFSSA
ncbi:hypothetical protein PanWU01x14_119370 [Parasponia andersonii]|uniref:Uncharacterized protein n=1 Tax=Parasponia andersonii TaxID=3476 RepID=A0A2P5CVE1_PARAD|nr:hypothetical protein PanWU01x14_119370 [Parasponia andersonii]